MPHRTLNHLFRCCALVVSLIPWPINASLLDVDADGTIDALTDGSLIVRYLLGYREDSLTQGAIDAHSVRTDPQLIAQHIQGNRSLLDIDGSGRTDAQTDGMLILRYLTGLTGEVLTADAIAETATRTTPDEITAYLDALASDTQADEYPGAVELVFATATGTDSVELAWTPANDNDTAAEQIEYIIHRATTEDFIPDATSRVLSVTGATAATIDGLTAGTTYTFAIVARDSAGYESAPSNRLSASAKAFEDRLIAGIVTADTADLGLATATLDGDLLHFPKTGQPPEVGTYLTGELADGSGYLKEVLAVDASATEWILTTRDAPLSELVEAGSLSDAVRLIDVSQQAANQSARQALGQSATAAGLPTIRRQDTDAGRVTELSWPGRGLSIRQIDYGSDGKIEGWPARDSGEDRARSAGEGAAKTITINDQVTIGYGIADTPTLTRRIEHGGLAAADAALVRLKGPLSVYLSVEVLGKLGFTPEPWRKRLIERRFSKVVVIGKRVPVWLDAYLNLDIEVEIAAEVEARYIQKLILGRDIDIAYEYRPSTGWRNVGGTEDEWIHDMVYTLKQNGKVVATVTLIPNVELKINRAVAGVISVEPALAGALESELVVTQSIKDSYPTLTRATTRGDVTLSTGCFIELDLKRPVSDDIELLPKTQVCDLGELSLFTLPEIGDLQVTQADGRVYVSAPVEDGVNNPFNVSSADWVVIPPVDDMHSCGRSMSFTPKAGVADYSVIFSGYGRLGGLGRQFKVADVALEAVACRWLTPTYMEGVGCYDEIERPRLFLYRSPATGRYRANTFSYATPTTLQGDQSATEFFLANPDDSLAFPPRLGPSSSVSASAYNVPPGHSVRSYWNPTHAMVQRGVEYRDGVSCRTLYHVCDQPYGESDDVMAIGEVIDDNCIQATVKRGLLESECPKQSDILRNDGTNFAQLIPLFKQYWPDIDAIECQAP